MTAIQVNADNFARAESDRMFASFAEDAGGTNLLSHNRRPTPIDHQPVIRQNRDTLYSFGVFDTSAGLRITLPDAGDRYLSAMVVNEDHHVTHIVHDPGLHEIAAAEVETPYAAVALRILVDASDPSDVAAVNALQDRVVVEAGSARGFRSPDYDAASLDETREGLLILARRIGGSEGMFGRRDEVRHLIGSAAGWGGLPEHEATYVGVAHLPVGEYRLTVRDVPVDGFWSLSLYDAAGYFEPNERGAYNVNSVMAERDPDGAITVHFGGTGAGKANWLPTMEGWNYLVRLYRPRAEILDRSWTFPVPEPVR
jgi:hypothetical protein